MYIYSTAASAALTLYMSAALGHVVQRLLAYDVSHPLHADKTTHIPSLESNVDSLPVWSTRRLHPLHRTLVASIFAPAELPMFL